MEKILVIDDDANVRRTVKRILTREGHHVIEAKDGSLGVSLYRVEKPDLVITDIIMPEKEGIETITDIRKEQPAARIIAMSGGARTGNADYLAMARKLGAREVLAKPFGPKDLLDAVARCLAG